MIVTCHMTLMIEPIKGLLALLMTLCQGNKNLQYIEFTCRNDLPKEHVVLNLNTEGGLHVFES